jgi:hypothetical protein
VRKLTPIEETAYENLKREGSVLIAGDELQPIAQKMLTSVFDSLVKKKRAVAEPTDGGVRYHAT